MVCNPCYDSNLDGVAPDRDSKLLAYLQSKGIATKLNDKGLLNRP